jgi:hypothetical protein
MVQRQLRAGVSTVVLVALTMVSAKAWAATDDACSLVTQAEVTAALGSPVQAGTYDTPSFKRTCTFNSGKGELVTVNVMSETMFKASTSNSMGLRQVVPVSGVGDEAYFVTQGNTLMLARKGSAGIKVAIYSKSLSKDQIEGKEKSIAAIAVSRM